LIDPGRCWSRSRLQTLPHDVRLGTPAARDSASISATTASASRTVNDFMSGLYDASVVIAKETRSLMSVSSNGFFSAGVGLRWGVRRRNRLPPILLISDDALTYLKRGAFYLLGERCQGGKPRIY
jgi:hypothetical protein